MKLYYAPGVCSQAVRITLSEMGADFELEKVDSVTKKTDRGYDYTMVDPLGYVPALELDSGEVLLEAPAILLYLADLEPDAALAPPAGTLDRIRLQQRLSFTGSELHKSFGPFFAKVKPEGALREQALHKLTSRLDALERVLSDGRPFIISKSFTIADAYTFVVASWVPLIGLDTAKWANIKAYLSRVGSRPRVKAALQREGLTH